MSKLVENSINENDSSYYIQKNSKKQFNFNILVENSINEKNEPYEKCADERGMCEL